MIFTPTGIQRHTRRRTFGFPLIELREPGIFIPTGEEIPVTQRALWCQCLTICIDILSWNSSPAIGVKRDGYFRTPCGIHSYSRILTFVKLPIIQLQIRVVTGIPTAHTVIQQVDKLFRLQPLSGFTSVEAVFATVQPRVFVSIDELVLIVLESRVGRTNDTSLAVIDVSGEEEVDTGIL